MRVVHRKERRKQEKAFPSPLQSRRATSPEPEPEPYTVLPEGGKAIPLMILYYSLTIPFPSPRATGTVNKDEDRVVSV